MGKLFVVVISLFAVVLVGGATFLAFVDMPAPKQAVEQVLPDARFPR
jgi:hypothetical protein